MRRTLCEDEIVHFAMPQENTSAKTTRNSPVSLNKDGYDPCEIPAASNTRYNETNNSYQTAGPYRHYDSSLCMHHHGGSAAPA